MTVMSLGDETIAANGRLTYNMSIAPGIPGGKSVITITPNHNISGIGAR